MKKLAIVAVFAVLVVAVVASFVLSQMSIKEQYQYISNDTTEVIDKKNVEDLKETVKILRERLEVNEKKRKELEKRLGIQTSGSIIIKQTRQPEEIKQVVKKIESIKPKRAPSRFSSFRAVVQLEETKTITAAEAKDQLEKIIKLVCTSPLVKSAKLIDILVKDETSNEFIKLEE